MKKKTMFSLVLLFFSMSVWSEETVKPTMVEIECAIKPIVRSKILPSTDNATSQSLVSLTSKSTSPTLSGYVAATNLSGIAADHTVTYVGGSWKVPTIEPAAGDAYCSIWVGMDGYLNTAAERVGTSHNWVDDAQQNYAWFEISPNGAFEISSFPVDNGDVISTEVTYMHNAFKLTIYNHTKGVSTTLPPMPSNALRSCATWVVEAMPGQPLADFQSVTFNYCSAVINGVSGTIDDGKWKNDQITMVNKNKIRAQPSALLKNGSCFHVTWQSH
jgi:hypothetical protein